MWTRLKLKVDESSYFLEQMRAHVRHPRIFLFYLTAFLSSSRSVTWHLQKVFKKHGADTTYKRLREEMLADEICKYFVKLRNYIEKEGYPPLGVEFIVGYKSQTGKMVWYQKAGGAVFGAESKDDFAFLDRILKNEWDFASMGGIPAQIVYRWRFGDHPEGRKDVVDACKDYFDRLWYFVASFREVVEPIIEPDALDRKIDLFLAGFE
jgi:hypothetical protein